MGRRGRPPAAQRRTDIDAGRGMASMHARQEHARHATRFAREIVAVLNEHVADPTYNVARDLIAVLMAGAEAGNRCPRWRTSGSYGFSFDASTRPATQDVRGGLFHALVAAYLPCLATAPVSSLTIGLVVRSALIGDAEQRDEASTPLSKWEARARRHRGGDVLGLIDEATVSYASKRQRLERRAAYHVVTGSACGWTPFPQEHPNLHRAQERVRDHRAIHGAIPNASHVLTIEEGVMLFGEGVGTCAEAERLAHKVIFYCCRRYESGAPRDIDMLCVCRGSHCTAPYFVGRSKTPGAEVPKYCAVCSGSQEAERKRRSQEGLRRRA